MPTTKERRVKQKVAEIEVAQDPAEVAEEAGLRYVSDEQPGYTRKPKGDDFEYFDTDGKAVKLSDFKGKKSVVLAFYVLAFTGG